jgi:hypothetical protein
MTKGEPAMFEISYHQEIGCVVGVFTGELDVRTIMDYVRMAIRAMEDHSCWRFLDDLRHTTLSSAFIEIYSSPDILETLGLQTAWKRAILAPADSVHEYDCFEMAAANREHQVKVFTDYDKAVQWLHASFPDSHKKKAPP